MSQESIDLERHRLEEAAFRAKLSESLRHRPVVVYVLVGVMFAVAVAVEFADSWLPQGGAERIVLAAGMASEQVRQGQWGRLWTAALVHSDWPHMLLNAIGLLLIGRHIEVAFGSVRFWWLIVLTTWAGGVGTLMSEHVLTVGASGAVFGLIGALIAIGLRLWPRLSHGLRKSLVLLPTLVIVLIVFMGLVIDEVSRDARVDHHAHIAGAVAGLLGGMVLQLRLRDADGEALLPLGRPASRQRRWLLGVGALVWVGLLVVALVNVMERLQRPIELVRPEVHQFVHDNTRVHVPQGLRSGIWRGGRCQGALVDSTWALQTRRVLCFELSMGGVLLVGRRRQLLTMDEVDVLTLRQANTTGRLTWRQKGVLLYPLGDDLLYAVLGPNTMLEAYARALRELLPAAAMARVALPLQAAVTGAKDDVEQGFEGIQDWPGLAGTRQRTAAGERE